MACPASPSTLRLPLAAFLVLITPLWVGCPEPNVSPPPQPEMNLDATPVGVDATPVGVDAGPIGVDAIPIGVDATPVGVDAGPVEPDAEPMELDAGAADSGVAPETTLTITPPALDNDAMPTFEFSSPLAASFECRLDNGQPTACTSPYTITVAEGIHSFSVAAVSASGLADPSPARFEWTTDLTAPRTTITSAPQPIDNSADVSFEFSASEQSTFECSLDGAAFVACTSPFSAQGLADGEHAFSVRAVDQAGNAETPATQVSFTIDTALPDTTIDGGPSGFISSNGASLSFSSPNAGEGATFDCSLDSAAFAACTSPVVLSGLAEGAHGFAVRAGDAAGNTDPTPAERTWTVDTVAPILSITGGPAGITSDSTPSFAFTSTGATRRECRFDADAYTACTSPFAPASALADGPHTFYVRASDDAANTTTASRGFRIDTVAPVVAITGGPAGPTGDSTPTFTFTSSGATSVQCRVDTAAFAACTSPFTPPVLGDGPHTFEVRGLDAANNVTSATRSFNVDTLAPTASFTGGPSGPTNDSTPTFTFTTAGSPTSVQCRIGTVAPFASCTSPYTPAALADGSYTVYVRVADAAGNSSTISRSFSVDTAAPGVTITGGPAGPTNIVSPSFTFTTSEATTVECRLTTGPFAACTSPYSPPISADDTYTVEIRVLDAVGNSAIASRTFTRDTFTPSITVSGTPPLTSNPYVYLTYGYVDGGPGPLLEQCRLDSAPFTPCANPYTTGPLGDGPHTYEVMVIDPAGNVGLRSLNFTIDTQPPAVAVTNTGYPYIWTGSQFTFTFTAEPGASTGCRFYLQGAPSGAYTPCSSPYTTATPAESNNWTFEVRATDGAGNWRTSIFNFTTCIGEGCY